MFDVAPALSCQTKFARFLAFGLCALPVIFAIECLLLVLAMSTFQAMFADFGAKLPIPTQLVLDWRIVIAAVAVITAVVPAVLYWHIGLSREHVIVACTFGLLNFVVAQATLLALFLPIFQLGAVSGGL